MEQYHDKREKSFESFSHVHQSPAQVTSKNRERAGVEEEEGKQAMKVPPGSYAYLQTSEWPFSGEQFDIDEEARLGTSIVRVGEDVPVLCDANFVEIQVNPYSSVAGELKAWDQECAQRHLAAVGGGIILHQEILDCVLGPKEEVRQTLNLAGISNAPGSHDDLSQCCQLSWTSENRVIFSQAVHTAEVGVPQMGICSSWFPCCVSKYSKRKWNSYWGAIPAQEVLEVFVQQSLTTNYENTPCECANPCEMCRWFGGTLSSLKSTDGMTQTLGDYDQKGQMMRRWNKSRFMRQSMVIRYIDKPNDKIAQVIATTVPHESVHKLYKLAATINAARTINIQDWLSIKHRPFPGNFTSFASEDQAPFFSRTDFRVAIIVSYIIPIVVTGATRSVAGSVLQFIGLTVALAASLNVCGGGASRAAEAPTKKVWAHARGIATAVGGVLFIIGLVTSFA